MKPKNNKLVIDGRSEVSSTEKARRAVRALNKVLGLSQEHIAKRLGVSYTTVNAWATGKSHPRKGHLDRLEALLSALTLERASHPEGRTEAVLALLEARYGSPALGNYSDPLDELFFILLSLKTTYRTYEQTFRHFKSRFHPWSKLLRASSKDVESCIRKGGLGSIKARAFIDIVKRLKADFGKVSLSSLRRWDTKKAEDYLRTLPGVGQKTARCVLMYAFGRDVLPVDTHTYRVGVRIGIVPSAISTSHVHEVFDQAVPAKYSYSLHTNFVSLGRDICLDPTPKCEKCPVQKFCDWAQRKGAAGQRKDKARSIAAAAKPRPAVESPVAVDIYAGCGGLSAGLEDAGLKVAYALDWDKHACETHQKNLPHSVVECVDVRKVSGKQIASAAGGRVNLVVGGPNCQGVSERGLRNPDDPRNFMFPEYVRLVSELRPDMFLMENVPGLAHRHNFGLLKTIFTAFQELGYKCSADVLLAANYGVPQLRYRFFLVGTILDAPITFPAPTHHADAGGMLFGRPFVTVGDALGDLPPIGAERQDDEPLPYLTPKPANDFQRYVREDCDAAYNHVCTATQEINLSRARHVPEGGCWKNIPPHLLPDRFFRCRMTDHSTTYYRLRREQPAFTITALFGNITAGAFTHPLENRALSIREGARLQSFRDKFIFCGPRNKQYRQIGNAVPPLLARAMGAHLKAILAGERVAGITPRITEDTLNDKSSWEALPILTPRFKALFGAGTRWPVGWGPEPKHYSEKLDGNYSLRSEFWPEHVRTSHRKPMPESDLVLAE